jgi:hypothetical protein
MSHMAFLRRRAKAPEPAEIYLGLRNRILHTDPAEVGLQPSGSLPHVWGFVMDWGVGRNVATLVCVADGTTSLYFSNGGARLGGGQLPQVASASLAVLGVLERFVHDMPRSTDDGLPGPGGVVLRALTYDGVRAVETDERTLRASKHPLWTVYAAAQDVITELRLVEERRQAGGGR